MKTIEQLLKPVIAADIQSLLNELDRVNTITLNLTNDFNIQSKDITKNDIQAIIKTGAGTRSTIKGVSAVQTPITIMFQVPMNRTQELLGILNTYCQATNGYTSVVVDDMQDDNAQTSLTYQYSFSWGIAIPNATPYKLTVKSEEENIENESIDAQLIMLSGQITYTSSMQMDDEEFYLYVEEGVEGTVHSWTEVDEEYYEDQAVELREEMEYSEFSETPSDYEIGYTFKLTLAIPLRSITKAEYDAGTFKFQVTTNPGETVTDVMSAIETQEPQLYGDIQEGMHGNDNTVIRADSGEGYSYWTVRHDDIYLTKTISNGYVDGYVKIEGIITNNESLTPTINSTSLMEQYKPALNVVGDTQQLVIQIAVMTSNKLHAFLLNKFYTVRTGTSFDVTMKQTRESLNVDLEDIAAKVVLSLTKQNGFEYLTITITKE